MSGSSGGSTESRSPRRERAGTGGRAREVTLKVYDWRFRDEGTEMLYYEAADPFSDPAWDAGAAVGEGLTPQAKVVRLHEARGYYERPLAFKRRFRLCKAAARVEDVDPDTVRALRPFIEQWEPDWVEWVKRE